MGEPRDGACASQKTGQETGQADSSGVPGRARGDGTCSSDAGVSPRAVRRVVRSEKRWSKKLKAAFLDHLAATCNVKASAESVGVPKSAVYTLRQRDPAFAAGWSAALALGYEMLETHLVGHALSGGGARVVEIDGAAGPGERSGAIDVELALKLLSNHRNAINGKAFVRGPRPSVATREETNAAILKKLRVMEAQVRAEAAALATTPAALAIVDGRTGA